MSQPTPALTLTTRVLDSNAGAAEPSHREIDNVRDLVEHVGRPCGVLLRIGNTAIQGDLRIDSMLPASNVLTFVNDLGHDLTVRLDQVAVLWLIGAVR